MTTIRIYARRTAAALLLAAAILFCMPLTAFADSSASLSVPQSDIARGSEFTVSVKFDADSRIGTVQAALSYSEQDIEFVSSDFAFGGGGIVNIAAFPQRSSSSMTVSLKFRALRQGSSEINLTNGSIMSPDGAMIAGSLSASAQLTVGSEASNADSGGDDEPNSISGSLPDELRATLGSMSVSAGELKPAFSPGIYDYTVTVPNEVEYFTIDAEPAGLYDTIWFEGSEYLLVGNTLRTITVTSGDGTVSNVYTVTVTRLPADDNSDEQGEDTSDDGSADADSLDSEVSSDDGTDTALTSSTAVSPRSRDSSSDDSQTDKLRDKLMPAMIAAMAVIILAVAVLVVYIRKKSQNKLK